MSHQGAKTAAGRNGALVHLLLAAVIGLVFFLPQPVRMQALHSVSGYSPFSARTLNPETIDETFLYGSEVNYTYRHHRPAYDTDAYEHRNQPMPYSILPTELEVGFARAFHGVDAAQIFCFFLFPAITAYLLIGYFVRLDASVPLAAFLALFTTAASFSLRTVVFGFANLLRHGWHSGFINTLASTRNPNPNMTFALFLGALLCLLAAMRRKSIAFAIGSGVLGGLLFYSYVFYAIAWSGSILLLSLLVLWRMRENGKPAWTALLTTILLAIPFLLWVRAAKQAGGYYNRFNRLGLVWRHMPPAHELKITLGYCFSLLAVWLIWRFFVAARLPVRGDGKSYAELAAIIFGCALAGGILDLNLEVVTGIYLQYGHHVPHMVLQPVLILLGLTVLLAATLKLRRRIPGGHLWSGALFVALLFVCATVQVEAGINSAPAHRVVPWQQELFHWLNHNSSSNDVVATTSLELATYMPLYSQDYTLMVNGTRTSASDSEIIERFLLAEALTGTPPEMVAARLGRGGTKPIPGPPWSSYASFFFEHSPDLLVPGRLKPSVIQAAIAQYRAINIPEELKKFRVNYLYTQNGELPVSIAGYQWREVFATSDGTLWRLLHASGK